MPSALGVMKKDVLKYLPYIDYIPDDGRALSLIPFFDEKANHFRVPVPQPDKTILLLKCEPVQSPYFAKSVAKENDLYSSLIELVTLSWSFPKTMDYLLGMERDMINCSSVVEKYFVFLDLYRSNKDSMIANLLLTDIEFLFGNIRSFYDSMQGLIGNIMNKADKTKPHLPESFYDVIKLDRQAMTKKYSLEQPLVDFYANTKEFFMACRTIRGGFQHWMIDIPVIFCFDDGFALTKDETYLQDPIVARFKIWPEGKIKENGLVSLLGLIACLNETVLSHLDMLSAALKASVPTPTPISKDFHVFFRAPHIHHLIKSRQYQDMQWIEQAK